MHDMSEVIVAFGPGESYFVQSPSLRRWNNLCPTLHHLIGASDHVQRVYHMTLGTRDTYFVSYRHKTCALDCIVSNGLPSELTEWLEAVDDHGRTKRVISDIKVVLGAENSYWATDGLSSCWGGLPPWIDRVFRRMQKRGSIPKTVAMGFGNSLFWTSSVGVFYLDAAANYPELANTIATLKIGKHNFDRLQAIDDVIMDLYIPDVYILSKSSSSEQKLHYKVPSWMDRDFEDIIRSITEESTLSNEDQASSEIITPTTIHRRLARSSFTSTEKYGVSSVSGSSSRSSSLSSSPRTPTSTSSSTYYLNSFISKSSDLPPAASYSILSPYSQPSQVDTGLYTKSKAVDYQDHIQDYTSEESLLVIPCLSISEDAPAIPWRSPARAIRKRRLRNQSSTVNHSPQKNADSQIDILLWQLECSLEYRDC